MVPTNKKLFINSTTFSPIPSKKNFTTENNLIFINNIFTTKNNKQLFNHERNVQIFHCSKHPLIFIFSPNFSLKYFKALNRLCNFRVPLSLSSLPPWFLLKNRTELSTAPREKKPTSTHPPKWPIATTKPSKWSETKNLISAPITQQHSSLQSEKPGTWSGTKPGSRTTSQDYWPNPFAVRRFGRSRPRFRLPGSRRGSGSRSAPTEGGGLGGLTGVWTRFTTCGWMVTGVSCGVLCTEWGSTWNGMMGSGFVLELEVGNERVLDY